LPGTAQLLAASEARSRRLFAIAQSCIEYEYLLGLHKDCSAPGDPEVYPADAGDLRLTLLNTPNRNEADFRRIYITFGPAGEQVQLILCKRRGTPKMNLMANRALDGPETR
jgi:hypothetical protein